MYDYNEAGRLNPVSREITVTAMYPRCPCCKAAGVHRFSTRKIIIQFPPRALPGGPTFPSTEQGLLRKKVGKDSPKRGSPLLGISPFGAVFCTQSVEAGTKSGTAGTPAEKNDRYKPIANRQGNFPCLFAAERSVVALELERQNRDVVVVSVNMPHFRRSGNFLGDFLGGKGTVQLQFREDPVISRHSGPVGD